MHHMYICVHEIQSLFSNTHAQTQRSNRYFRTHTHITSKAIQSLSGIDSISGWVCEANTYMNTAFFNIAAGHAPVMLKSQSNACFGHALRAPAVPWMSWTSKTHPI